MTAVSKCRIASALLLLWVLALPTDARSADASLRKASSATQESEAIPRRAPRPLSRREIFRVIQNDLAQKGIAGREGLQPEDLRIQSAVPALKDDAGLEVKRIGFDPIRGEVVFELWASREPQYLPFKVTTRRDRQSWGLNAWPDWKLAHKGGESRAGIPTAARGTGPAGAKSNVLAKAGSPATLVMLGQNVRITTTVVPLQPGVKGQRIFVRDPATQRVMSAEVVDEGLLRTSF
jgi:hypothetical protein